MANSTTINRNAGLLFGIVFVAVGALGFVAPLAPDNKLLGIFAVSFLHNAVHLLTGAGLLITALPNDGRNARMGLLVFGSVYGVVTILGTVAGGLVNSLGIAINTADNVLHVVLTAALLGVPLAFKDDADARTSRAAPLR